MVRYFAINMDKDIDNFIDLYKQCKKYDIELERIPGVDISKMSDNEKKQVTTPFIYKYGTNGMIGCFLAHKNAWLKVANDNIDYAVIFEDDIIMDKSIKELVEKVLKNKYRFDIMLLGCHNGCKNPKEYNLSDIISTMEMYKSRAKYKLIDTNVHIPEFFTGTHAYIITNKSAKKLLKLFPKVSGSIDRELSTNFKIKKISLNKNAVIQNSSSVSNNTGGKSFLMDRLLFDHIYINQYKPISYSLNAVHMKWHSIPITIRYFYIFILILFSILSIKHFYFSIIFIILAILLFI